MYLGKNNFKYIYKRKNSKLLATSKEKGTGVNIPLFPKSISQRMSVLKMVATNAFFLALSARNIFGLFYLIKSSNSPRGRI